MLLKKSTKTIDTSTLPNDPADAMSLNGLLDNVSCESLSSPHSPQMRVNRMPQGKKVVLLFLLGSCTIKWLRGMNDELSSGRTCTHQELKILAHLHLWNTLKTYLNLISEWEIFKAWSL